MPIGERIKQVRKVTGLTQDQFGKRLCVTFQAISKFEKGTSGPSDQTINLICREFGVREAWLRTGEGPMMEEKPRDEALALKLNDILTVGPEDFRRRLISVLVDLPPEKWSVLEEIAVSVRETVPASAPESPLASDSAESEDGEEDVPLTEAEIEEKVAAYRALVKKGRAVRLALGHGTPPQTKASGDTFGSGTDGGGPMA